MALLQNGYLVLVLDICMTLTSALQVIDALELTPINKVQDQPFVIAVAAWFGSVRLIDNIEVDVKQ